MPPSAGKRNIQGTLCLMFLELKKLPKMNIFWMLMSAILIFPASLGVAALFHDKLKHKSDINDLNLKRSFFALLISTVLILVITDDRLMVFYPWSISIIFFLGLRITYFLRVKIEKLFK